MLICDWLLQWHAKQFRNDTVKSYKCEELLYADCIAQSTGGNCVVRGMYFCCVMGTEAYKNAVWFILPKNTTWSEFIICSTEDMYCSWYCI